MMVVSCQVPEGFRSRRRGGVVFACGELLCKVSVCKARPFVCVSVDAWVWVCAWRGRQ